MAKNGFWSKHFVKLIYLISRVFLAWTFYNFLAHCDVYLIPKIVTITGRGGKHNDRGSFRGNREGGYRGGRGEGGRGGYRGGNRNEGNFKDREFRQSNRGMNGGGHREDRRGQRDGHRGQFRGGHQQQNGFKEN